MGTGPAGHDDEPVELVEPAHLRGIAGHDVDLAVGVVGAVCRDDEPVGDEPHGRADRGDIRAEPRRQFAIDLDPPLDARHRPAVADLDQAGLPFEGGAGRRRGRRQPFRIAARELELHGLAHGRAGARGAHLHPDAREVAHALAQLGDDLARRAPAAPVGEFEKEDADHVLVDLFAPAPIERRARVDPFDPRGPEDARLHLADETVALEDREIAARVHHDLRPVGFDLGKELDPAAEARVGPPARDENERGEPDESERSGEREAHQPHVEPDHAAHAVEVSALGGGDVALGGEIFSGRSAEKRADHGHEDERHEKRGAEGGDERDR